jgi:prepilin peptidase CpaA
VTLIQVAVLIIFPALLIVAALTDLTSFTIPNRLSLLLAAAYPLAALALGRPFGEIGICLAIGAGALVVAVGMFAAGWIGGGDAKLLAAAALWLGWPGLALKPYLAGAPAWLGRLTTTGESVPYGVAIAAGALAAFPQSSLISGLHISF